jgi:uncharacterized protein (DUF2249 family)
MNDTHAAPSPLFIDVRHLQPPEPFERIVLALRLLEGERRLRVLIHREPLPLYKYLAENGFAWTFVELPGEGYELTVWRDA